MSKLEKVIEVKGRKIGGEIPQVCTPLVAKTEEQLFQEAEAILALKPDLVEWRVDYFDDVENIQKVLDILSHLRKKLEAYPIIFTCRVDLEGGHRKIENGLRFDLIKKVIKSRQVDIVDVELISGEAILREIIAEANENDIYVIISNHDFQKTPSKEEMIERLRKAQEIGADIAKIAVMPNTMEDVLNLLYATNTMKEKYAEIPLITMSMSGKGLISRMAGGVFGSAVTFGAGKAASAPGQIAVAELREVIDILHKNM